MGPSDIAQPFAIFRAPYLPSVSTMALSGFLNRWSVGKHG